MKKAINLIVLILSMVWLYKLLVTNPDYFKYMPVMVLLFGFIAMTKTFNKASCKRALKGVNFNNMSGLEFEEFTTNLYEAMGYTATKTKASGDFGADVILQKRGEITVVQCKRYNGPVGLEAVQQVVAARAIYKAKNMIVITNSTYTKAAQTLAQANKVQLIDGDELNTIYNSIVC